jgi:TfoX/Sxy family transcriptional regulator of competence genes
MAFDEGLAQRVREALSDQRDISERRMFGGLAFMQRGHMIVGVVKGGLMARVGAEGYAAALAEPHAREMDFTGRPLTGFVYVEPAGFETDAQLQHWVRRCTAFAATLPAKPPAIDGPARRTSTRAGIGVSTTVAAKRTRR